MDLSRPPKRKAPATDIDTGGRGGPGPSIRRADLLGNVVDLAAYQGEPVLLLFWSPGCGHCQALLPHILAYERSATAVRMIVLSGGSTSVNLELGFASPVVLDEDRAIARSFGVTGTPAAVLIRVGPGVAPGAAAVRAYLDRLLVGGTLPAQDQTDFL